MGERELDAARALEVAVYLPACARLCWCIYARGGGVWLYGVHVSCVSCDRRRRVGVQNLQIGLSVDSTARVPFTTLSRRHKRVCSIAACVWRTLCSAMKSISIFELRSSNSPRIRDSWSPTPFRYARGWLAQHKIKHTLIETATHFERYETTSESKIVLPAWAKAKCVLRFDQ